MRTIREKINPVRNKTPEASAATPLAKRISNGIKPTLNKFLSLFLLFTVTLSIIQIVFATAPNPGHNFTESSGGVATGDLLYGSATDTLSALADVATGSVLVSGGVGVAPAWSASPTITGNFTLSKADPTITLTDTGDSNATSWTRSDTNALMSFKNTAQEGGVAVGLDADGVNDGLQLATTTNFDGHKEFTMSFWLKIDQQDFTAGYFPVLNKFSGTDSQRSWDIRYRDVGAGNNRLSFQFRDNNNVYPVNDEWILSTELYNGNWHHLVVRLNFNTGAWKIFFNNATLASGTNLDTSTTMKAGGTNRAVEMFKESWLGTYLDGKMDQLAIWNRTLTDGEVGDLYNSGNGFYGTTGKSFASSGTSFATNLKGLWHMDENTGTTIADTSGEGVTGTFDANGPAWATGHITSDGTDYTVTYLSHQDGGSGIRGITTLGNTLGDTYINGKTTYSQIAGSNETTLTNTAFSPSTSDGNALGTTTSMWSDLFLALGGVLNWNAGDVTITHAADALTFAGGTKYIFNGRVETTQGADVASASSMTLGTDGNVFEITGTTAINLIANTNWQEGSKVTLLFNDSVTVNHATATSGSNITILLAGAANFSATANDTLTLVLSSTTAGGQAWREVARTVI